MATPDIEPNTAQSEGGSPDDAAVTNPSSSYDSQSEQQRWNSGNWWWSSWAWHDWGRDPWSASQWRSYATTTAAPPPQGAPSGRSEGGLPETSRATRLEMPQVCPVTLGQETLALEQLAPRRPVLLHLPHDSRLHLPADYKPRLRLLPRHPLR